METIRVMNRPEDYAEANINKDHVEVWEEGERNKGNKLTPLMWKSRITMGQNLQLS